MSLVFAAISRTGPDPSMHHMFELSLIAVGAGGVEAVQHWGLLPEQLTGADPGELVRTRYFQRWDRWGQHNADAGAVVIDDDASDDDDECIDGCTVGDVARQVARVVLGAELVTLGLDGEAAFLAAFLARNGHPAGWVGHYDVTVAAAGALAGYTLGWQARGRRDAMPSTPAGVDVDAAKLPHDPFRLARAIGAKVAGDPVSARVRAELARSMYGILAGPLGDALGVTVEEKPAPDLVPPPPPVPPVPPVPASTGDPDLDRVAAAANATGPFSTAAPRMPLEPRRPEDTMPHTGGMAAVPPQGPPVGQVPPGTEDAPLWPRVPDTLPPPMPPADPPPAPSAG